MTDRCPIALGPDVIKVIRRKRVCYGAAFVAILLSIACTSILDATTKGHPPDLAVGLLGLLIPVLCITFLVYFLSAVKLALGHSKILVFFATILIPGIAALYWDYQINQILQASRRASPPDQR
jgi:hypothetical protein